MRMDMRLKTSGRISFVGDVQTFSGGFTKRTFVLSERRNDFTNHLAFVLTKERTAMVDPKMVGTEVEVVAYVRSRKWENPKTGETRWFTEAEAASVSVAGASEPRPREAEEAEPDDPPF